MVVPVSKALFLRGVGWMWEVFLGIAVTHKRASILRVVQQHALLPADRPMARCHVVLTADASPVLQESKCKHTFSLRVTDQGKEPLRSRVTAGVDCATKTDMRKT